MWTMRSFTIVVEIAAIRIHDTPMTIAAECMTPNIRQIEAEKYIHAFLSSKAPKKDLDLTTHRKLGAPNDEKRLEKFRSCKGAVGLQLHGTTN